jgi:hypothetical protein
MTRICRASSSGLSGLTKSRAGITPPCSAMLPAHLRFKSQSLSFPRGFFVIWKGQHVERRYAFSSPMSNAGNILTKINGRVTQVSLLRPWIPPNSPHQFCR